MDKRISGQLNIFDITANKHGGNEQSEKAFEDNKSKAGRMRLDILKLAEEKGRVGITTFEVTQLLGLRTQTASARMSELKRDLLLFDSGERRKTDTGSSATVLVTRKILAEIRDEQRTNKM